MVHLSLFETPWGAFAYAVRAGRLLTTFLPEPEAKARRRLQARFPDGIWCSDGASRREREVVLPEFRGQVLRYFAGEPVQFTTAVDLICCPDFHRRVLLACRKVPFGETITYGGLAAKIGHPGAARAVGQAMAANPIPLVIPCHRVVAANGRLGGFSSPSGAQQKLRLLRLENPLYEAADSPQSRARGRAVDQAQLFAVRA